jgi:Protein of unknown function (DUF3467)
MNRQAVIATAIAFAIGFALAKCSPNFESQLYAQRPERTRIPVDDTNAVEVYANFCRVTGTLEKVILDYRLNTQPFGTPAKPIPVGQRIVVNFYTAKRML